MLIEPAELTETFPGEILPSPEAMSIEAPNCPRPPQMVTRPLTPSESPDLKASPPDSLTPLPVVNITAPEDTTESADPSPTDPVEPAALEPPTIKIDPARSDTELNPLSVEVILPCSANWPPIDPSKDSPAASSTGPPIDPTPPSMRTWPPRTPPVLPPFNATFPPCVTPAPPTTETKPPSR
jgi:hypothetical protein